MQEIIIIDSTLRDGNHAVRHQLNANQIASYATAANSANIPVIIIGHGNGLGASSIQVGESLLSDMEMIKIGLESVSNSKLGVFDIPGFSTINKDLKPAIDAGIDLVCVASHCTEADTTKSHINYAHERGIITYGNLMMTHMVSKDKLLDECAKLESYGADGIIIMDSAGAYIPNDVQEKISVLVSNLEIPIGFHAHNNLGLAVANSITAVEAGATILDCSARGFGAGAGNAPIELLVAVLDKMGYNTGINLYDILDSSDIAEKILLEAIPYSKSVNIVSGLAGVFSGFVKHVERISNQYNVDSRDVFFEVGRKHALAGQEDIIIEVAIDLANKKMGD
jgi:4-hydroxy 2-oxovalerate aldolase